MNIQSERLCRILGENECQFEQIFLLLPPNYCCSTNCLELQVDPFYLTLLALFDSRRQQRNVYLIHFNVRRKRS